MKSGSQTTEFRALIVMSLLVVGNYATLGSADAWLSIDIPDAVLMTLLGAWAAYGGGRSWTKGKAEDGASFRRDLAAQIKNGEKT